MNGEQDKIKEYAVGIEVFDKDSTFDPRTDTIVRVEARRLRSSLIEYYATQGRGDALRIDYPKGSYVPVFRSQESAPSGDQEESQVFTSIAALPFVNMSDDPANEYFSDGLTEELINALSKIEGLHVAARTSVFQFKGKNHDIRKIGRQLNVGAVLEGSVRREGDRVRVTAQLNSTANGYHLWSETYDRDMKHVFAIQEDISQAIAQKLRIQVPVGARRLVKQYTEDPEAHDLYLRGRYFWNKRVDEAVRKGITYFQQAIDRDPGFALAWSGLADCFLSLAFSFDAGTTSPHEAVPRAKAALSRALEIDDSLPEAHISLAFVRFLFDWDWRETEAQFGRALELNPRYAHAHHWYSHYLMAVGRVQDSLVESKRALELDPLDAIINTHMGWHHLYAHEYKQAIEHLDSALELAPNYFHTQRELGRAYAQMGRYREAVNALQKALRLAPEDGFALGALGNVYGLAGKKAAAEKLLAGLKKLAGRRYVSPYFEAAIYAGLGRNDLSITSLEKAYAERADALVYLKAEPMFANLHGEPKFAALLEKMAL